MVEDPAALDALPAIMATPGLDAIFIGRGDLATALEADGTGAPPVVAATERIAAAARAAGRTMCAHVDRTDSPDVAWLRGLGVSAFLVSSDQGLMRRATMQAVAQFRSA
jgi:2-keto-3-deoxy-L-rhamnonate aldolase RhmA